MRDVKLTEAEFHRLLRYNDQLELIKLRGETLVRELQDAFAKAQHQRDAFFVELCDKYEDLKKDKFYIPNEETMELCLQENENNA